MAKRLTLPSALACQRGITRSLRATPVIFLSFVFGWCYWAYHFRLCQSLFRDGQTVQGALYIVFFQPLFFLCLWSYWQTIRTSPGLTVNLSKTQAREEGELEPTVREDAQLLSDWQQRQQDQEMTNEPSVAILDVQANNSSVSVNQQLSTAQRTMPLITVKRCGARRFCQKCQLEKYDRTHHCRTCKSCVLKMDHHCPWVNNCVGFYNYKFFYLFIVYASLVCIYVFSTTLPPTIQVFNGPSSIFGLDINWLMLVFVSGTFGIFLVPFSCFHTMQILNNRTTIEFYEKANYQVRRNQRQVTVIRDKYFNPWDMGSRNNAIQVLGNNKWKWFLPIGTPQGNGRVFPLNELAYSTLETDPNESMETL